MSYYEIESRCWKMQTDSFDIERLDREMAAVKDELVKTAEAVDKFRVAYLMRVQWLRENVVKGVSLDLAKGEAYKFDGGGVEYRISIQPYYFDMTGKVLRDDYNDGSYGTKFRGQTAQYEALTNMVQVMMDNPQITRIKVPENILDKLEKLVKKTVPEAEQPRVLGLVEREREKWKQVHIAWGR